MVSILGAMPTIALEQSSPFFEHFCKVSMHGEIYNPGGGNAVAKEQMLMIVATTDREGYGR